MSYAIVRNEKLTRVQAQGICVHNDRKTKNHSNKEIDEERIYLNYYLKKNKLSYIKEFDRIKKENNLQGQIRSNSIIMCEMIFTGIRIDKDFFDKIGIEETNREHYAIQEFRNIKLFTKKILYVIIILIKSKKDTYLYESRRV